MIATGVALILLAFFLLVYFGTVERMTNNTWRTPGWIEGGCYGAGWMGFIVACAGFVRWLWLVAP